MWKPAIILPIALALTSCTSAQIAADQAKVDAAVNANAANIASICKDVMTVADDPLTNLAALTVPIVAQMQASSRGVCLTAAGIAAAAKSATTAPWLSTASTVMASQGAVLPPPVAPMPITSATP